VEALTDEVEAEATAYIEEIKDMGDGSVRDGVLHGIDEGYFHREIQQASYEYQERVDSGDETVVGVNAYEIDPETEPDLLRVVDETTRERQLDRLESVKAERDDDAVEAALDDLRAAIDAADENVMPAIVTAVKSVCDDGRDHGGVRGGTRDLPRADRCRLKRGIRETIRPQIGSTGCADSARHAFPGGRCAPELDANDRSDVEIRERILDRRVVVLDDVDRPVSRVFAQRRRSVVVTRFYYGVRACSIHRVQYYVSSRFNVCAKECRGRRGRVPGSGTDRFSRRVPHVGV